MQGTSFIVDSSTPPPHLEAQAAGVAQTQQPAQSPAPTLSVYLYQYLHLPDGKLTENGVNALKIFINNFRKYITVPSLFAKGGRMGFKALSEKVAQNYEGKSVPAKYRPEYGSRYDKEEAKEVGNKVAAKVYRMQQGK